MAVRSGVLALAFAGFGSNEAMRVSKTQNYCGAKGTGVLSNETGIQIVNGEDAPACAWKWQVGLRYGTSGLPFCGGTLINEDWVLTAAHCGNFPDYNIVAGDWKPRQTSGNEQNRRAVQLIWHPLYQSSATTHDFALVRVDSPFIFNDCVGAACLPDSADIAPGSSCWITGWGTLRAVIGRQPDILQQGKVTVLANNNCGSYPSGQIDDSMLCAQGQNANGRIVDGCQGDSGGPLVCEANGLWTLYGATSWGRGCGRRNFPGIWARVFYVMDWVNEVLESNSGPAPPPPTRPQCPDFAAYPEPDEAGDCRCPGNQMCSTNGGASVNCPSGAGLGWYFFPHCSECQCYSGI